MANYVEIYYVEEVLWKEKTVIRQTAAQSFKETIWDFRALQLGKKKKTWSGDWTWDQYLLGVVALPFELTKRPADCRATPNWQLKVSGTEYGKSVLGNPHSLVSILKGKVLSNWQKHEVAKETHVGFSNHHFITWGRQQFCNKYACTMWFLNSVVFLGNQSRWRTFTFKRLAPDMLPSMDDVPGIMLSKRARNAVTHRCSRSPKVVIETNTLVLQTLH